LKYSQVYALIQIAERNAENDLEYKFCLIRATFFPWHWTQEIISQSQRQIMRIVMAERDEAVYSLMSPRLFISTKDVMDR
jgi:hypothetical protein